MKPVLMNSLQKLLVKIPRGNGNKRIYNPSSASQYPHSAPRVLFPTCKILHLITSIRDLPRAYEVLFDSSNTRKPK